MKKWMQQRGMNYGLMVTSLALTAAIGVVLVRRFLLTGQDWMIFATGIVAFVTLAVLAAVFGPRWRGR